MTSGRARLAAYIIISLVIICSAAPSSATACTEKFVNNENYHCYELVEWRNQYGGPAQIQWGYAAITSTQMNAPPSPDRMQNEMWVYPGTVGPWVEDGDTIGLTADGYRGAPTYFWAGEQPNGNYYEQELPNGPALGTRFWVTERAAGSGIWCAFIGETGVGCQSGYSTYAVGMESGLEAGSNTPPDTLYNSGSTAAFYQELNGGDYPMEPGRPDTPTPFPAGVAWCYIYPNPYKNEIAFGTGYAPCPPGEKETENRRAGADERAAANSLSGDVKLEPSQLTEITQAQEPAAGYVQPTGPKLSSQQLQALVRTIASEDSTGQEVSEAAVYNTSLAEAEEMMEVTRSSLPPATSGGMVNWLKSEVDLVVLQGHFTLDQASIPRFASFPSGTRLELAVDAHTGTVDGVRLIKATSANIAALSGARVLVSSGKLVER